MKRYLPVVVVLLACETAPCATLGMRWRDVAGNRIELAPQQTHDIEFYIQLIDGEVFTALGVRQHIVPVSQIAAVPADPGWGNVSENGSLGINPQWVAFYSPTSATNFVGPGEFNIGYQTDAPRCLR